MNKRYVVIISMVVMLLVLSLNAYATADWYNESYNFRRNVSFVTSVTNATNFIGQLNLTTICGNNCNPTKTDIMLVEYDGSTNSEIGFTFLNKSMEITTLNTENSYIVFTGLDMKNSYYVYYNSTTTTVRNTSHYRFFESWDDKSGTTDNWGDNWLFATASRYLEVVNTPSQTLKNSVSNSIGNNPCACKYLNNQNSPYNEFVLEAMYYQDSNISDAGGAVTVGISGGTTSCTTPSADQPAIMIVDGDLGYICDGTYGVDSGIDLETDRWYSLRIVQYNISDATLWIDDLNFINCSTGNASVLHQIKMAYGNGFSGDALYTLGKDLKIDSVKVYYDLDARTYLKDYTLTYGGEEIPTADLVIQSVELVNQSLQDWGGSFTQNKQPFFILANVTLEGLQDPTAVCNYTTNNISHNFYNGGGDRSLTSSDSVEFITTHSVYATSKYDILSFDVCHNQTGTSKALNVYINDNSSSAFVITAPEIPSCSVGVNSINRQLTGYIASENFNVSLRCPSCLGVNTLHIKKLSNYPIPNNIKLVRSVSRIEESGLDYNVTSKLYTDSGAFHSWDYNGELELNVTCNETTYTKDVNVTGNNPLARFLEIETDTQEFDFITNNTIIQNSENTTIRGDCYGSVISKIILNITYSNDTLIQTSDIESITLQNKLNLDGLYYAKLSCYHNGNITNLVQSFWSNDTVNPTLTWTNPAESNNTEMTFNTTNLLNLNMYDVNLFAYRIEVIDPNNVIQYVFNATNLNSSQFIINENILPATLGTWKVNATVTDDHTKKAIDDYKYSLTEREIIFSFDKIKPNKEIDSFNISVLYDGVYPVDEIATFKDIDRYKFKYKFRLGIDKFNDDVDHKFRVVCDNIIYRENSDYPAHFICNNKYWLDFSAKELISYSVKRINSNTYDIIATMDAKETIIFSSLGGLNEINEVVEFEVIPAVTPSSTIITSWDFSTTQGVMMIFVLIFLYLALLMIAMSFKNFIFGSFAFFIGLLLAVMFMSLMAWLSIVFFLFNVLIFFFMAEKMT